MVRVGRDLKDHLVPTPLAMSKGCSAWRREGSGVTLEQPATT